VIKIEEIIKEFDKVESINKAFQSVLDIIIVEAKEMKKVFRENQELY
jgi:hypothetical protein